VGVLYGVQHQRTLYKKEQKHKDSEEYAHKEALIRKAKEEYKKKTSPPSGILLPSIFLIPFLSFRVSWLTMNVL